MSSTRKRSADADPSTDYSAADEVENINSPKKKLAKTEGEVSASASNELASDGTKNSKEQTTATSSTREPQKLEIPVAPTGFLAYAKVNPFANAMSAPILGAISPKSPKPNPFSSPVPAHNPFMSFTDEKSSIWGTLSASSAATNATTSVTTTTTAPAADDKTNGKSENDETKHSTSPVKLEPTADVDNGEQGEECIFQLRAKLFRLSGPEKPSEATEATKEDSDKKEEDKDKAEGKTEWVEVGIGPLRVLESTEEEVTSKHRLVMRRENQPGGQGTKLLLNVLLKGHVNIVKVSDKASRLTFITTLDSDPSVSCVASYLVKTKQVKETDELVELVTRVVSEAA